MLAKVMPVSCAQHSSRGRYVMEVVVTVWVTVAETREAVRATMRGVYNILTGF